jgi:hypothetical protein
MRLPPMVSVYRKLQVARPFQHAALELFEFIYVHNTTLCLCLSVHGPMEGGGIDVILKTFILAT